MLGSIAWPVVLGLVASAGFYLLVFRGPLGHPVVHRYFAGHPVCVVETIFFFICISALVQKLLGVLGEYPALASISLGEQVGLLSTSAAGGLLEVLAKLSPGQRRS